MLTRTRLALLLVLGGSTLVCKDAEANPLAGKAPLRAVRAIPLTPGTEHNARSPLGTNLTSVTDYSTEWAFVDAFKASRTWISSAEGVWDDQRPIDVDTHGWVRSLKPGQHARTLLFWDMAEDAFPAGEYVVTYTGKGVMEVWPQEVASSEPGKIVVKVDPKKGGISLLLKATDPADPLKNIRVTMPGFAVNGHPTFHPTFLACIRSYKVLRFMDWFGTNDSKQAKWSERPLLTDARYDGGVPVEAMIELANTAQADPWVNVPHLADDDYIEQLAKLLATTLDKNRIVYIEHSNEVWNSMFEQARAANAEGKKRKLAKNEHEAAMRFHSERSVAIFRIFERVFGGTARIVRVMGGQAGNAWASNILLEHRDAWQHTDALAIAPYFGGGLGNPDPKVRDRIAALTLDQMFDVLRNESLVETREAMKASAEVAKHFGVPLVAYEGGQHLVGVGPVVDDAAINKLFDAANRDPRMRDLYASYLAAWKESGGQTFVNFVNVTRPTKWGRWGALESQHQQRKNAPKFDAIQTFITKNPIWWQQP